jgi:phosphoribosyl-AMP cyclohydrolase (EC 3.5.4.19)
MDPVAVVLTLTHRAGPLLLHLAETHLAQRRDQRPLQIVKEFRTDCDGDAVVIKVFQIGAACHLGTRSCLTSPNSFRVKL